MEYVSSGWLHAFSGEPARIEARITRFFRPPEERLKPFFEDLRFDVAPGEIACVMGLSGVGKSTLVQAILDEPGPEDGGELQGEVDFKIGSKVYVASQIRHSGLLAQLAPENGLLPWRTVRDNLALPAQLNRNLTAPTSSEVDAILKDLALHKSTLDKFPHKLSFGTRQRVTLGRGLLYKPRFLLLDEAFTGLDEVTIEKIGTLLGEYVTATKSCCLLVTHNIHAAFQFGSASYILSIQSPSPDENRRMLYRCGAENMVIETLRETIPYVV